MLDLRMMLLGTVAYLRENPAEILRVARKASKMRFGLPVRALSWLIGQVELKGGPSDIEIEPCPPGIRVTATVEEMGTLMRGSAVLSVLSVDLSEERLAVEVRLSQVTLRLLDENIGTPLAALIRSGALDLTRVATLVAYMPHRPAVLVDAEDDRLVLDFMQLPSMKADARLRRLVGVVAQLLRVDAVETDDTHLELALRAFPNGVASVFR